MNTGGFDVCCWTGGKCEKKEMGGVFYCNDESAARLQCMQRQRVWRGRVWVRLGGARRDRARLCRAGRSARPARGGLAGPGRTRWQSPRRRRPGLSDTSPTGSTVVRLAKATTYSNVCCTSAQRNIMALSRQGIQGQHGLLHRVLRIEYGWSGGDDRVHSPSHVMTHHLHGDALVGEAG